MKDLFETKERSGWNSVAVVSLVVVIAVMLIVSAKINPTGFIIFSQQSYTFDFSNPAEYSYNSTLINFTAGAVSLNLLTNTTTTSTTNEVTLIVINAMESPANNVTAKVIEQGDGITATIEKANTFNVTFNSTVSNGDVIKMYLKGGYKSNVTLCNAGTQCGSPGQYGIVFYPASSQGYYYITVSGLSSPVNTLTFDNIDNRIIFDYIAALHNITTTTTTNTTYYPGSAAIETSDLSIGNISYWGLFTATETLNGQTIGYEYSTDSGSAWSSVSSGENLSSANASSGKIRFKAALNSGGSVTPALNAIGITYQTQFTCTESWGCTEWSECSENSTQTRTCTDDNACGTTLSKPNEMQTCTYIPPCTENWTCAEWSSCYSNNTQARTCSDSNSCGTILLKPNETQSCTYVAPEQLPSGGSSGTSSGEGSASPLLQPVVQKEEKTQKPAEPKLIPAQKPSAIETETPTGELPQNSNANAKADAEQTRIMTGYATMVKNYSIGFMSATIIAMLGFYAVMRYRKKYT